MTTAARTGRSAIVVGGDDAMTELPNHSVQAATELAQIASGPDDIRERARLLLTALRPTVPFSAASVSVLNPAGPGLVTLARVGEHQHDPIHAVPPMAGLTACGQAPVDQPVRFRALTVRPRQPTLNAWPVDRASGVDVCLLRADGSAIGVLSLQIAGSQPLDAIRDLLGLLAPVIAYAVDPMRSAIALVSTLADTWAGVALTRHGGVLALPGLPAHDLLGVDSPEVEVAAQRLAEADAPSTFLSPSPGNGTATRLKITTLSCPTEPPYDLVGIVVVSPAHDLCGLTGRELEILGLMVEGCSNQRMATALYITERTVAAHVEHILAKLGVPTRTLAAVRAHRMGLYVPPALAGVRVGSPDAVLAPCR